MYAGRGVAALVLVVLGVLAAAPGAWAQTATTTQLTVSPAAPVTNQSVTLTATVDAGGTPPTTGVVTFSDANGTLCSQPQPIDASGTATCTTSFSAGSEAVTAAYSDSSAAYGSSSPAQSQTFTVGPDTTAVALSGPSTAVLLAPTSYTVQVSPAHPGAAVPSGSVAIEDNNVQVSTCSLTPQGSSATAICNVTFTVLGSGYSLTARFIPNDSNFSANDSNAQPVTVFLAGSSTSLTAAPTNPVTNQQVTLTATVSPALGSTSGTVAFFDQGTPINDCADRPVDGNGVATCTTSLAASGSPASLTATYSPNGQAQAAGSTSAAQPLNVGLASTGLTLGKSSAAPSVGQPLTYTASVTPAVAGPRSPTGTVAFYDGSATIPTCAAQPLSGTTATCTVTYPTTGSHTITAAYAGDANFTGSTSFPPQTLTLAAQPPPAVDATTRHTSHLSTTAAILNGLVATHGQAVQWQFQYGATLPFTHATPLRSISAGHATVPVAEALKKLKPGTVYRYELVVITPGGAPSFGHAVTFTTKPLGKLSLPSHRFTATGKAVAIPARCLSKSTCTGRFSLSAKPKTRTAKAPSCGTVSYRVSAGQKSTVTLTLRHACAALLTAKHRRLSATLTVAPTSGQLPLTRSVTLLRG
jgi:hypothetical protein